MQHISSIKIWFYRQDHAFPPRTLTLWLQKSKVIGSSQHLYTVERSRPITRDFMTKNAFRKLSSCVVTDMESSSYMWDLHTLRNSHHSAFNYFLLPMIVLEILTVRQNISCGYLALMNVRSQLLQQEGFANSPLSRWWSFLPEPVSGKDEEVKLARMLPRDAPEPISCIGRASAAVRK